MFWNQSWKLPDRGQFGSVVWSRTVTWSLVRWNAGNSTTGVRPGEEASAVPGSTASATAAATAARIRNLGLMPANIAPAGTTSGPQCVTV
ncbi:hypothetical protein [Kutzneria kofuensis]|uniref:hypothetical protein n=1 Tax=Kutzneria kofuensis TaxID=103725 RepID=UPI0031EEFC10